MSKLSEIEARLERMYLINPADLGAFSNTPSMRMVEADMLLLIRAVRQLSPWLSEEFNQGKPDYATMVPWPDPDVLELLHEKTSA